MARVAGVPAVVAAVAGLGRAFVGQAWRDRLLRAILYPFYNFAFNHPNQRVIFQNTNDCDLLIQRTGLDKNKTTFLRGSGVKLEDFHYQPEPVGTPTVVFAARLLRDKGIFDFIEAARLLSSRGVKARFHVLGLPDRGNKASVTESDLCAWREEAVVKFLGHRSDVPYLFSQANIVCLPSYYGEGVPKVLLEAAAAGRAVVTTDHPGCRDAIEPGLTGLLVPVHDPVRLAEALQFLLENCEKRRLMGLSGRKLAEREYAIERVVTAHLAIYDELT